MYDHMTCSAREEGGFDSLGSKCRHEIIAETLDGTHEHKGETPHGIP